MNVDWPVDWPVGWLLPAPPRSECSYLHAPESFPSDWLPGLIFQITWEKFPGRGRGRPWDQRRTDPGTARQAGCALRSPAG